MILVQGEDRKDRTGTGTKSIFSPPEMIFNLQVGFPLLTTKHVSLRLVLSELLWFLSGSTNVKDLQAYNNKIWNPDYNRWVKAGNPDNGELGPIYGKQWVDWNGINQIKELIEALQNNPQSRRHILSAWNVGQLKQMALPPCHIMFQLYVSNDGGLSMKMYQRSADWFLGKPFNIASYALLTHMIAQVTGLYAKELIMTDGDAHIYNNHIEAMTTQVLRGPEARPLPTIEINPDIKDINQFKMEDFVLWGYDPLPAIKGDISVGE